MIKKLLFIAFAVFLYSCKEETHQISEQVPLTPQQMILGHWAPEPKPDKERLSSGDDRGFEFKPDNICDYKIGFYDWGKPNIPHDERYARFLGTKTKYHITKDSLKIYDLREEKWQAHAIKKLTKDTLIIGKDLTWRTFLKKVYKLKKEDDFDAVIVSSSTCNGLCPQSSTMITKEGDVIFLGEYHTKNKGYFHSKISKEEFKQIASKFKQSDYKNITFNPSFMSSGGSIEVAFIKDGEIIKSTYDRTGLVPPEFIWAYSDVIHLEQKLELQSLKKYFKFIDNSAYGWFSNEHSVLELTQAESFYLGEMFQAGNQFDFDFIETHELRFGDSAEKITTDGRYYKFYFKDKTTKTIDIGFNFLTNNNLFRKFQKINE